MPTFVETEPTIAPGILDQLEESLDNPWVVILYNDDWHPFEQVILQIQKATGYSEEKAQWITYEAHITGRAVTFTGNLEDCERVARILRDIKLQVETDKA
jgi:ATP-dependent Clp protease adaptor protein ClpS